MPTELYYKIKISKKLCNDSFSGAARIFLIVASLSPRVPCFASEHEILPIRIRVSGPVFIINIGCSVGARFCFQDLELCFKG